MRHMGVCTYVEQRLENGIVEYDLKLALTYLICCQEGKDKEIEHPLAAQDLGAIVHLCRTGQFGQFYKGIMRRMSFA